LLYFVVKNLSLIVFKLIFRLKVSESSNIPETGPFIVVANHSSFLDGFILTAIVNPKITFISAAYLFRKPFVGSVLKGLGAIPNQNNGSSIKLIRKAIKVLQTGGVLGIFPSGKITNGKDDFSTKSGAAYLAVKTVVPIIPMKIKGANKALPLGAKFPRLKKLEVQIGKPIYCSEINRLNKKILEDIAKSYMKKIY